MLVKENITKNRKNSEHRMLIQTLMTKKSKSHVGFGNS